jgi:hypothetical protein
VESVDMLDDSKAGHVVEPSREMQLCAIARDEVDNKDKSAVLVLAPRPARPVEGAFLMLSVWTFPTLGAPLPWSLTADDSSKVAWFPNIIAVACSLLLLSRHDIAHSLEPQSHGRPVVLVRAHGCPVTQL